jgi:gluconate 2-dehydrogenase gamma chain
MLDSQAQMQRRELFGILAAGAILRAPAVAQHGHQSDTGTDPALNYRPRFFSDSEYSVIDRLANIIIPSDSQSPGAHDAGVAFYIDTVLHYADPAVQRAWRSGMAALEASARDRFGVAAAQCKPSDLDQFVAGMASHESDPGTELDRFLVRVKKITIEGYFLSDVGRRDYLGYRGDAVLAEFRGCTHPEHQT